MIAFLNTFLSYLLLMIIILVVGGIAITIGINMRKAKNSQVQEMENVESKEE